MPAKNCGCCRAAIKKRQRGKRARCHAGHVSDVHRRCLKAGRVCGSCSSPFATLLKSDGTENDRELRRVRAIARNEALARALWTEFESGKLEATIPKYVEWRNLQSIKDRMRSMNVQGDRFQQLPNRADSVKLEAFLASIKRA